MSTSSSPRVGVLAVQGDAGDHARMLERAGAVAVRVRRVGDLERVDALVIPGGESTTMIRLVRAFDLLEPVRARVAGGMPVYGSCAGMILLADHILDGEAGQESIGGLDVVARRNAFGRQVASFEADVEMAGVTDDADADPVRAVFIRAPWIESAGPGVTVLATVAVPDGGEAVVAVRQVNLLATSFHPEITDDPRVHHFFVEMVRDAQATAG